MKALSLEACKKVCGANIWAPEKPAISVKPNSPIEKQKRS
ncbi:hypothetical protein PCIT_a2272 [Pseudoalteromonas citrea]|uniref:Uncharacterized protein n=1 Tax=Pseudoalteromonas citrea TaxID=43655 RepID=A0AAD4FSF3_9GAMM|nr:hypothetical protein PCIT_a2272 [Pseudoalteromonas citrea]